MDVTFVSYSGRYPNLCGGVLTLLVDGVEHTFGPIYEGAEFCRCWGSGGRVWGTRVWIEDDSKNTEQGPWTSDWFDEECAILDRHFGEGFSKKVIEIMNDNVRQGCCGGCI